MMNDDRRKEYNRLFKKRFGRPQGRQNNGPIVRRFAATYFHVTIDGKKYKLRPFEIVILVLRGKAAEGDVHASEYLEFLKEKYSSTPCETDRRGPLVVPEAKDAATWVKEQEQLNELRTGPGVLPPELYVKK